VFVRDAADAVRSEEPTGRCRGDAVGFFSHLFRSISHVHELKLDAEVVPAHRVNGGLQVVSVLACNAHLVLLNRYLHLELRVLDVLDNRARLLGLDPFLDLDDDAGAALAGWLYPVLSKADVVVPPVQTTATKLAA